ncbi:MAG TPA: SDR family NAD(P)-dependent oxidoreductase [Rhodanobacteraceae bacterium]|jgi:NADP-dependent 3-hydroxy acid dehydrogenase YdfG|nr:SDR family NAD(P)-dependent oxidoreductase [Rhodanobacteraceae bacterium]
MGKPLAGRVALVTGASSGIGDATARALADAGAKVAIAARRHERLDVLARELVGSGAEVFVLAADLAREEENRRIVVETEAHFGRLDILVNNAGVMLLSPVDGSNPEDWRRMLELNVLAPMVSSQAALPGMRARGGGHIVSISSTAGRIANPNAAGYSASKFGVVAFSESLRREVYKDNIRVTVIEPGIVETELREHIPHAGTKQALDAWAAGMRQLQPEDVANAVLYCVTQPSHVNVNEILMRPTDQER